MPKNDILVTNNTNVSQKAILTPPNLSEKELLALVKQYERLLKARYARQSFYLFCKYTIGYNNQPNHLIQPHAHLELCHLTQGTLKDIDDIGGYRLEEGKKTVYDTFQAYQTPPLPGSFDDQDSLGVPPNPSIDEKNNSQPVNLTESEKIVSKIE